LTLYLTDVLKC